MNTFETNLRTLLYFLFRGQRPSRFLRTVLHGDQRMGGLRKEMVPTWMEGLLALLKDGKVGKSSETKDLEEGHRVSVIAACRVSRGTRGKRSQPIIKNGSRTN